MSDDDKEMTHKQYIEQCYYCPKCKRVYDDLNDEDFCLKCNNTKIKKDALKEIANLIIDKRPVFAYNRVKEFLEKEGI